MTIQKTWKITQLQAYPESNSDVDFVCSAAWNVSGNDGTYGGNHSGSTYFKLDSEEPFTPYDQLEESQLLDYVFKALGEDGVSLAEADVDSQIKFAASSLNKSQDTV